MMEATELKPSEMAGGAGDGERSLGKWLLGKLVSEASLLPVSASLVAVCVVFQLLNDSFLTAHNLTNLMLQVAAVGTISIGVVLVLLLGEIDLSVGAMSGCAAAFLGWMSVTHGVPPGLAIVLTVLTAAAYGAFQGIVVTSLRLPAFVITLASLIALQGIQLILLGPAVSLTFPIDGPVVKLTSTFFDAATGWTLAIVCIVGYVLLRLRRERRLRRAGLPGSSLISLVAMTALVTAAFLVPIAIFNQDRGLPLAVILFVGLVLAFDFITRRTVFGRHIFAVGGDAEAARRTGVPVRAIKISVFACGSALAAFGGIMAASRLFAATGSVGAGSVLINAIAAAVIGGTSLFGGRGTVFSALIGTLLIGAIANGMALINLSSADQYLVTGVVLAGAVSLDALLRLKEREQ